MFLGLKGPACRYSVQDYLKRMFLLPPYPHSWVVRGLKKRKGELSIYDVPVNQSEQITQNFEFWDKFHVTQKKISIQSEDHGKRTLSSNA